MFCKNCGKQLSDDERFCPSCGTPREIASKCFCTRCGAEKEQENCTCPKCGAVPEQRAEKTGEDSNVITEYLLPICRRAVTKDGVKRLLLAGLMILTFVMMLNPVYSFTIEHHRRVSLYRQGNEDWQIRYDQLDEDEYYTRKVKVAAVDPQKDEALLDYLYPYRDAVNRDVTKGDDELSAAHVFYYINLVVMVIGILVTLIPILNPKSITCGTGAILWFGYSLVYLFIFMIAWNDRFSGGGCRVKSGFLTANGLLLLAICIEGMILARKFFPKNNQRLEQSVPEPVSQADGSDVPEATDFES